VIAVLVGVALASPGQAPLALAKEPALARPARIQANLRSVASLLSELSQKHGVALRASAEAAERKVALQVERRPLGWTLDRVADVLDLEWRREGGGYLLVQTPESALDWARARAEAHARRRAEWRAAIERLARAGGAKLSEVQSELFRFENEAEGLRQTRPPGWSDRLARLQVRLAELRALAEPAAFALAHVARNHRAELEAVLLGQRELLASSSPLPGVLSLPPEALPEAWREGKSLVLLTARWSGEDLEVGLHAAGEGAHPAESHFLSTVSLPLPLPHFLTLFENKGGEPPPRFAAWGMSRANLQAALAGKTIPFKRGPDRPFKTPLDLFIQVSQLSQTDFVADAFHARTPTEVGGPSDLAEFWTAQMGGTHGPWVQVVDGAVLYRHAEPWIRAPAEIPESRLEALRKRLEAPQAGILEIAAEFVGGLTEAQKDHLGLFPPFRPGEPLDRLSRAADVLTFWSRLSSSEKASALRHEVVAFEALSPPAQGAYRALLRESLYRASPLGAVPPADVLARLARNDFAGMAFLVEPVQQKFSTRVVDGVTVLVPIEEAGVGAPLDATWADVHFYFGLDAERSLRYTLAVPILRR
jgi:hypothetical protein